MPLPVASQAKKWVTKLNKSWFCGRSLSRKLSGSVENLSGDVHLTASSEPTDLDSQSYAIKISPYQHPEDQHIAQREIEVLDALDRLKAVEVSANGDEIRIATNYFSGDRLDKVLKRSDLSMQDRFALIEQILGQFEALHSKGFVHCDSHASNVLVDVQKLKQGDKGAIHLIDFGLSLRMGELFQKMSRTADTDRIHYPPEMYRDEKNKAEASASMDGYPIGYLIAAIFSKTYRKAKTDINVNKISFHDGLTKMQQTSIQGLVDDLRAKSRSKRPNIRQVKDRLTNLGSAAYAAYSRLELALNTLEEKEKALESASETLESLQKTKEQRKLRPKVLKPIEEANRERSNLEKNINIASQKIERLKVLLMESRELLEKENYSENILGLTNKEGLNFLQQAIMLRRTDIALMIVNQSNKENLIQRDPKTPTAIHLAAWFGDWDLVASMKDKGLSLAEKSLLIENYNNPNKPHDKKRFFPSWGSTKEAFPLEAAASNDRWGLAEQLLKRGGISGNALSEKETLWHKLAKSELSGSELENFRSYVDISVVNQKNLVGNTALHEASSGLNVDAVRFLLGAGAVIQPNARGKRSMTLAKAKLDSVIHNNKDRCYKRYQKIVTLLQQAGNLQRAENRLLSAVKTKRHDFHHYARKYREVAREAPELFSQYLQRQLSDKSSLHDKAKEKLRGLVCVTCCESRQVQKLLTPKNAKEKQVKFLAGLKEKLAEPLPKSHSGFFKRSTKPSKSKAKQKLKKLLDVEIADLDAEEVNYLFESTKAMLKSHRNHLPAFLSRSGAFCREQYKAVVNLDWNVTLVDMGPGIA